MASAIPAHVVYQRRSSNPVVSNAPSHEAALAAANKELVRQFDVDTDLLVHIKDHFVSELRKGLAARGQTIAAIPTYVVKRVNGSEQGTYYALDLGGTNMRVCQVTLLGGGKFAMKQGKFTISESMKKDNASKLFDFIADSIGLFLRQQQTADGQTEQAVLGFTFSFPVLSTAIDAGLLLKWTKGFECPGAEGQDVIKMMQDACKRKNLKVQVAALVNDTVGTLLAHAYRHPATDVAIILGTGTNAAYYEKMDNITKWVGPKPEGEMVINIEWGAFDNERKVLPVTQYDAKADRESINPSQQIFEKMVSGMYLGEIVRNVLVHLIDCSLLFGGKSSAKINAMYGVDTSLMSRIESDTDEELANTRDVLENVLEIPYTTTLHERQCIKEIVHGVGRRSARLSAATLVGVLEQTNRQGEAHVGVDGSLFELYPHYKQHMNQALVELLGEQKAKDIHLGLARDGSGVGAALIALTNAQST